jgi:hypothetical protein
MGEQKPIKDEPAPMSIRFTRKDRDMLQTIAVMFGFRSHAAALRFLLHDAHRQLTETNNEVDRENEAGTEKEEGSQKG